MKINPVSGGGIMPPQRPSSVGQGNLPTNVEKPTEAIKNNQCGQCETPNRVDMFQNMSTQDMLQLVMAMQMMEKLNEITGNLIQKMVGSSD